MHKENDNISSCLLLSMLILIPSIYNYAWALTDNNNKNTEVKKSTLNPAVDDSVNFATYTDPIYGYSIDYPRFSNVEVGQPFPLRNANPSETGTLFTLDANAIKSTEVSDYVIVIPFHKSESELMKKSATYISPSGLKTFDTDGIILNANELLSFFNIGFTNFTLLDRGPMNLNNIPSYSIEYKYFNPIYRSPIQTKLIYSIIDDKLFIFDYTTKQSNNSQYFPLFQKMLSSFEANPSQQ